MILLDPRTRSSINHGKQLFTCKPHDDSAQKTVQPNKELDYVCAAKKTTATTLINNAGTSDVIYLFTFRRSK